jgi:GNAT superfamily N-acetyltransferase
VERDLEQAETAAFVDVFRATPDLCELTEIGGAVCTAVRRLPGRLFCRVVGLRSTEPLDEIAAFYGDTPWWVSDTHGLGPELEKRGFARDYSWMKFTRGVGPRKAHSELRVETVAPERAEDFALTVVEAFELPEWIRPMMANVVGRPGWSCYVAYDQDEPAAAGSLFVHEDVGWLGFGATRDRFRGRGAQSAILAARIEDARKWGCAVVTTETGELVDGRPSNSYRNILRAGFREAGVRANYRAPQAQV